MKDDHAHEFIKIAVLESIIESQVIESILNEQHIPYRIRSFHDTAYNGLFQVQKGWGELHAPSHYKQELLNILEAVRSADHPAHE